MKSTGMLWMEQVLIQYLTEKFEDAATLNDSDTVVEATDQGLPDDHQPATDLPSLEPGVAAERMSQMASDQ